MSYSAIEKMRKQHLKQFGKDVGPFVPPAFDGEARGMDLKSAALRFLDKRCEGLRFNSEIEEQEKRIKSISAAACARTRSRTTCRWTWTGCA